MKPTSDLSYTNITQTSFKSSGEYWNEYKSRDLVVMNIHDTAKLLLASLQHLHLITPNVGSLVLSKVGRILIGLRHFLKKAQVPGYESDQCTCGTCQETPRHLLLYRPNEEERREFLREAQGRCLDFKGLLDTIKVARIANQWMIKSGWIAQFQLAGKLLYDEEEG